MKEVEEGICVSEKSPFTVYVWGNLMKRKLTLFKLTIIAQRYFPNVPFDELEITFGIVNIEIKENGK